MDFIYITIWHEDIGKCKICHNDNQYVINSLSVTKHLRRHGIGSSLINSAEDIIKKLGGDYAYLYVNAEDVWKYEWYKKIWLCRNKLMNLAENQRLSTIKSFLKMPIYFTMMHDSLICHFNKNQRREYERKRFFYPR